MKNIHRVLHDACMSRFLTSLPANFVATFIALPREFPADLFECVTHALGFGLGKRCRFAWRAR